ncbi:CPBP family intramembrane metalloprotease [Geitlerinema sp. CS-897]|nr:CPBP family intramembrane metalloprotease [Geitlerinema sp. CS-897]
MAIVLHLIPFEFRFILLTAITPILFFLRPSAETKNIDLGLNSHNLSESIVAVMPLTLLMALPIFVIAAAIEPRYDNSELSIFFYIFYILISCPFQEFAYRGYLFTALDILSISRWSKIIVAAILYSFVHIVYRDNYILIFTFISGIIWNIHYEKYRNLVSVAVSHSILGVLTIILKLI